MKDMMRAVRVRVEVFATASCGWEADRSAVRPTIAPALGAERTVLVSSSDPSGQVATLSANGSNDLSNPFFQSLGTNGRTCATCHVQANGFGLSAATAQAVFAASGGADPLFARVDGANCPATTAPGAAGHSLLLNNGLIRVGITVPDS